MNHEMDNALPRLVGKTIAHIVLKEGQSPRGQIFLVFTDDTYYEFYFGAPVDGAKAVDPGGLAAAVAYGDPLQKIVFQC
jgi:hypothetical protein